MTRLSLIAAKFFAAMILVLAMIQPASADKLNTSDLSRAFGGEVSSTTAQAMSRAQMEQTQGEWIQIPIMIGRAAVTGFTRHGLNQTINRGISPGAIVSTLRNPTSVRSYTTGANAGTTRFIGPRATVVLNQSGRVVTTWGRGR